MRVVRRKGTEANLKKGIQRAFTLIELLVVIAIIAILAALLFPVFAEAKNSAKITVCISNMKQVATAFHMYLADNDDVWPGVVSATNVGPNFAPQHPWIGYDNRNLTPLGGWHGSMIDPATNPPRPGALDVYIKNEGVKQCPSRPQKWQMAMAYNFFCGQHLSGPSTWNCESSYYFTNPRARGKEFGPGAKFQVHDYSFITSLGASGSEVEQPADTLVVWEHGHRAPACNFLFAPNWFNTPPDDNSYRVHFNFLHRKGTTTIWADSHVRRMHYGQLKRPMFSSRKDIY